MCGLCGIVGNAPHWTDGAPAPAAADTPARRRARTARVAALHRVLTPLGLTVSDWQAHAYVVATRTGSLDELVVAGTGELVEQRNSAALAAGLERFLLDPVERRAAGLRGRDYVRAEFAAGETTRRLLELAGHVALVPVAVPQTVR